MADQSKTTVSAYDIRRQALWEMESTRRAQRRYQEAAAVADPSTLPSGQRLLREVVPPLKAAILQAQLEGQASIAAVGRCQTWAWPIQLLPAAALAVITLTVALNSVREQEGPLSALAKVANNISRGVREELEYRTWVANEEAANKAAKDAGDEDHVNVLARFRARYPAVDRSTWRRWKRKLADIETGWDEATAVQLGACLVHQLCSAVPHRFEVASRAIKGARTQIYLKLSAATGELMQDIETRAEVARPLLYPMLIPPIPWNYEDR